MLTKVSKGRYKWEITEEEKANWKYTRNELMFILEQMEFKLHEVNWETVSDEEANELAWIARDLTEKAMELIEK